MRREAIRNDVGFKNYFLRTASVLVATAENFGSRPAKRKTEMPIYELTNDSIRLLDETTFASAGISERGDLQRLLRERIEVISPDTLVIAEEFGDWDESRRRIDLLGIDKDGDLVVIELKRTEDGGHMELQAMRCPHRYWFTGTVFAIHNRNLFSAGIQGQSVFHVRQLSVFLEPF